MKDNAVKNDFNFLFFCGKWFGDNIPPNDIKSLKGSIPFCRLNNKKVFEMGNCKFCNKTIDEFNDIYVTLHFDSILSNRNEKVTFGKADTQICKDCAITKNLLPSIWVLRKIETIFNSNITPQRKIEEIKKLLNVRD